MEQRTIESGKAFAVGIFGSSDGVYFPEPVKGDPLLHVRKTFEFNFLPRIVTHSSKPCLTLFYVFS